MTEDIAQNIKKIAVRAVSEFEDVQSKYKELYSKYEIEGAKRRKMESQFKQLKQVSLLAVAEYESLHKQYTEENKYREKIENKLKQTELENENLRKLNQIDANTTIVSSNAGTKGLQETKGELELLRKLKDAVNKELREAKTEIGDLKLQLQQEKDAHAVTSRHLSLNNEQIRQLNRVSALALDEFNELKKKYELEIECRKKAEDIASEVVSQQKRDDRKSRLIIQDAAKDEQIKKFMQEIDEQNIQMDQQKKELEARVKELEEEREAATNPASVAALEEKLSLVMDQLELAQKQLVDAEERVTKAESGERSLYTRLAQAEHQLGLKASLPPPPPPPPPPIAAPVIRKFITRIGKKNKTVMTNGSTTEEDPRIAAMADMVERIKKGVKLRSVASPAKKDQDGSSAMGELENLLSNMKRGVQKDKPEVDDNSAPEQPEFARVKLKKAVSLASNASFENVADGPSNELMRKLKKQKSVAEALGEYPLDEKDESANQENIETKYLENVASDSSKTVEPGEEEKETSTKRFINVDDESARKNRVASVQEKQQPTDMQPKDLVEAEESENEKVEEVEKDIKKKDESKGDLKNPVEGSQQSSPENENQENENKKDRKVDSGNFKDPEIKNAENEEQGKRSMSEKKDRSSTASTKGWEAEVVIDATGRSKSKFEGMKTEVTSSVDEQDRKSVDDVFDELLTDLNTSIDKA